MTIPQIANENGSNNVTCNSININIGSITRRLTVPSFDMEFIVIVENDQKISARLQHHNLGDIVVSKAYANGKKITSRMLQGNPLSFQVERGQIRCAGAALIVPVSVVNISAACIIMCFNDATGIRNNYSYSTISYHF